MRTTKRDISAIGQFKNNFGAGNMSDKIRHRKGSIPGWASEMSHSIITIEIDDSDREYTRRNIYGRYNKFKNNLIADIRNYLNSNSNSRSDITINIRGASYYLDTTHFEFGYIPDLGNNYRTLTLNFFDGIAVLYERTTTRIRRGGRERDGTDYEYEETDYDYHYRTGQKVIQTGGRRNVTINLMNNDQWWNKHTYGA